MVMITMRGTCTQTARRTLDDLMTTRRRFVQGMAASGVLAATGIWPRASSAASEPMRWPALRGTEFDLTIGSTPVDFTGNPGRATTVNGSIPAPILYWRQGTTVTLRVTNRLSVPSSIHWHGILLPFDMDGVPGVSFDGIAPGETFAYRFPVRQAGTFWYHSHTRFQEQTGLYGPVVIEPEGGEPVKSDREYVLMLSDWTDEDPEDVFSHLKVRSDYYNFQMPTAGDFVRDVRTMGWKAARERRKMWNEMRMNPTDFSDVSGATYTYLVNGTTPAGNWTAIAKPGERVRLRLINGSASTYFDVRIPGVPMTVVAADGQDVEPVQVDELRIAVAETYDVIVQLPEDRAYTVFAQSMDRTGYARATLAPRPGMAGPVPPLDSKKQWLSMPDMGMGETDMGGMDMSGMNGMSMPGMDMSGMSGMQHEAHDMSGMSGMQHEGHDMSGMSGMQHEGHDMPGMGAGADMKMDTGPEVDMRSMSPSRSLSDPGPRLRDNGRRVLTYADLKTVGGPLDPRPAARAITVHLTGNMERFIWGFDGKKYSEAEPIRFQYGERLRIVMINDTMMNHPIHLHGMFMEVENESGAFQVRKHTVNVQPTKRVSVLVTADAPGQWVFHCHLLYHMEAGMFRKVVVA